MLGSFCNDDGDGSTNATIQKTSLFFKLGRDYSDWRKMSNVGEFPLELNSWRPPQSLEGDREICSLVKWRWRNVQEKRHARVLSCRFAHKTCCFFSVLVAVALVLLKLFTIIHSLLPFTQLQIHAFIDAEKYFSHIHWHERFSPYGKLTTMKFPKSF